MGTGLRYNQKASGNPLALLHARNPLYLCFARTIYELQKEKEHKMKVGIITLHRVYNYGSALQAYATQRYFERLGYDAFVIDYITPQRTLKRIFAAPSANSNCHGIKQLIYKGAKVGSLILKEMTFGSFIRKHLKLTSKYVDDIDLDKKTPIADFYVTGSDQTWNSDYNERVDRGFWLDFLPQEAKRISLAASFGKERLDDSEVEETKRYLARYRGISVREDAAVRIVNDLGMEAVQLIDPTFLLKKEDWIQLASKRLVKEKYLILMLLYNEDNHATEFARKIADEKGLKLVKISWEMLKPTMVDQLFTHRSPADFLSLFYYADFVVTNSFHGLAFSINLEKQFIVVPRSEFNSRIESLLTLTGLNERMVSSFEELNTCQGKIRYDRVEKILDAERRKVHNFLRDNLKC